MAAKSAKVKRLNDAKVASNCPLATRVDDEYEHEEEDVQGREDAPASLGEPREGLAILPAERLVNRRGPALMEPGPAVAPGERAGQLLRQLLRIAETIGGRRQGGLFVRTTGGLFAVRAQSNAAAAPRASPACGPCRPPAGGRLARQLSSAIPAWSGSWACSCGRSQNSPDDLNELGEVFAAAGELPLALGREAVDAAARPAAARALAWRSAAVL